MEHLDFDRDDTLAVEHSIIPEENLENQDEIEFDTSKPEAEDENMDLESAPIEGEFQTADLKEDQGPTPQIESEENSSFLKLDADDDIDIKTISVPSEVDPLNQDLEHTESSGSRQTDPQGMSEMNELESSDQEWMEDDLEAYEEEMLEAEPLPQAPKDCS